MRPRSMRGPSSSSTAGSTVTDPATAHATTAIVPAAIPVKMAEPIDELAGHRGRDGRAGDYHRATGGAGRALEGLVRADAAPPFLARADHVEERVVDAYGHADQQHNGLDAVVERSELADRAEQAERGHHSGQAEEHRHERGDERAEGDQQHEQGHGQRRAARPA